MSIYGGTYVGFIALEFSLYETFLRQIETKCEGKSLIEYSIEHVSLVKLIYGTVLQQSRCLMQALNRREVEALNSTSLGEQFDATKD